MLDKDNIWKDRFNDTSLEGEDWLEPNEMVLDQVMDAVKPKRNRKIFWWFFFGAIIGLGLWYWIPNRNTHVETRHETQSLSLISLPDNDNKSNSESSVSISKASVESNTIERQADTHEEISTIKKSVTTNQTVNKKHKKSGKRKTSVKGELTEKSRKAIKADFKSLEKDNVEVAPTVVNKIDRFATLPLLPASIQYVQEEINTFPEWSQINIDREISNNEFAVRGIIGTWNFKLNNNYSTALDPADFYKDNGSSLGVGLSFTKSIHPGGRLYMETHASLEKVSFQSGHNTVINYDRNEEEPGTHNTSFNLTMASPIGFLSSDVVISRSSDNVNNQTDLVIDLHNKHEFTTLDFGMGLSYLLFDRKSVELRGSLGMGVSYILENQNILDYCGVDNSDFSYVSGLVTSQPAELQDINPYIRMGLDARYLMGNQFYMGMTIGYLNHISSIYKEGDFSTGVQRTQIALQFGKNF